MKYIRTNYGGIVKCKQNEYNEWCYDFLGFPQIMPIERIVKIADTIEELCDEFVFIDEFFKREGTIWN